MSTSILAFFQLCAKFTILYEKSPDPAPLRCLYFLWRNSVRLACSTENALTILASLFFCGIHLTNLCCSNSWTVDRRSKSFTRHLYWHEMIKGCILIRLYPKNYCNIILYVQLVEELPYFEMKSLKSSDHFAGFFIVGGGLLFKERENSFDFCLCMLSPKWRYCWFVSLLNHSITLVF